MLLSNIYNRMENKFYNLYEVIKIGLAKNEQTIQWSNKKGLAKEEQIIQWSNKKHCTEN